MILKITIKNQEKPIEADIEKDLNWICKSLGCVSTRDFEETASKIFNIIVNALSEHRELGSEEIAKKVKVSRGAVINHLKTYKDAGFIIQKNTKYILRTRSVEKTIEEIEYDISRTLNDIKKIARNIDEELGLKER